MIRSSYIRCAYVYFGFVTTSNFYHSKVKNAAAEMMMMMITLQDLYSTDPAQRREIILDHAGFTASTRPH